MKLYKNVDIKDLGSILKNGILSMDVCGNNNWKDGLRSNNATDVVYLFKALPYKRNYFPQYGKALIECDVDNAKPNEFSPNDVNKGLYEEYITDEVKPQDIKAVYIPKAYSDEVTVSSDLIKYVDFISAINSVPNCDDSLDLNQYEVKQMELVSEDVNVKLFKHIGYVTRTKVFSYNGKQVSIAKTFKVTDDIKWIYSEQCYLADAYLTKISVSQGLENVCNIFRTVDNGVLYEADFSKSDREIIENAFIELLGNKLTKDFDLRIFEYIEK